jgi:hypothetical protein
LSHSTNPCLTFWVPVCGLLSYYGEAGRVRLPGMMKAGSRMWIQVEVQPEAVPQCWQNHKNQGHKSFVLYSATV